MWSNMDINMMWWLEVFVMKGKYEAVISLANAMNIRYVLLNG